MDSVDRTAHLSDDEIDAYCKGELRADDERGLEEHYLGCEDCARRVAAVDLLVHALQHPPTVSVNAAAPLCAWQLAAAVLAGIAVLTSWGWLRAARNQVNGRDVIASAAAIRTQTDTVPGYHILIAPPTRSASFAPITVPPGVSVVVFELDVAEGGAPLTEFDILLSGPDGRQRLRVETTSWSNGRLIVPVAGSLLETGRYLFRVTGTAMTLEIPILIEGPGSR